MSLPGIGDGFSSFASSIILITMLDMMAQVQRKDGETEKKDGLEGLAASHFLYVFS